MKFNSFNSSTLMPRQIGTRILGGDGITALNSIGSAGFWVRSGDRVYLATAGHVGPSNDVDFYYVPWGGEITNNTLIGKRVIRRTWEVDIGYIMKTNNNSLAGPIIRNTDNEEFPELQIMGVTDPDTEGTVVCKSGFTTHVTCGKITGIRNTVTKLMDGHIQEIFEINNHVISDMQCSGGDSGGPVYQYLEELLPTVLLVGIEFYSGPGYCLFQPLRVLLLPGMQVITINN
ncbi:serine protease [Gigaspora margarita]|nr:serine protease [Gigaspora margarita]